VAPRFRTDSTTSSRTLPWAVHTQDSGGNIGRRTGCRIESHHTRRCTPRRRYLSHLGMSILGTTCTTRRPSPTIPWRRRCTQRSLLCLRCRNRSPLRTPRVLCRACTFHYRPRHDSGLGKNESLYPRERVSSSNLCTATRILCAKRNLAPRPVDRSTTTTTRDLLRRDGRSGGIRIRRRPAPGPLACNRWSPGLQSRCQATHSVESACSDGPTRVRPSRFSGTKTLCTLRLLRTRCRTLLATTHERGRPRPFR
jgi:hypothetical protein